MTNPGGAPATGSGSTRSWFSYGVLASFLLIGAGAGTYLSRFSDTGSPGVGSPLRIHGTPRRLPDISFETAEGRKITLSDFRGKVVLLNLWATWCPPCRAEMPSLDRLQQKLGGNGFEVVALSTDTAGPDAVRTFYAQTGVTALKIYIDSSTLANWALGAPGLPTTVLVDTQGREVGRKVGSAEWDSPEAIAAIRRHLNAPAGS
jgi:thiol-disulfide isomerase/thioredoxin